MSGVPVARAELLTARENPELLTMMERRLSDLHAARLALMKGSSTAVRDGARAAIERDIAALTTCEPGTDWPGYLALCETLAERVRSLELALQEERAERASMYERIRTWVRRELRR